MSLNLTPTSNKYDRPLPPSRSKRSAQTDTLDSTPSRSPVPFDGKEDMGMASREELEDEIREKCSENEKLHERIEEMEERETGCQVEKEEMKRGLAAIQARCEEAFNEQARLETDVEARDELLDRLRSRLGILERELREAQRIAQVQERSFDSERTSLQAQEAHLQSRIRQLQTRNLPPSSSPSEILQEDLDSLRASHSTLLNQVDRLSTEVQGLRNENARCKEENEGWEYLVREQTFSNRLFHREPEAEEGSGRTQLDVLDEEMGEEMDDLNSDLNDQTPTIEQEPIFPRSTPTSRQPSRRMGRIASSSTAFSEEPAEGMDLAAELGRAGISDEMKPDAVEEENRKLREEVKALQLYCSKIIDRIIAQDGFEHILNVDYKTKRVGRAAPGGRGSLLDVVKMMQGDQPVPPVPVVTEPETIRARPVSMARGNSEALEPIIPVPEDKTTKRARRGFSLDLRTFGFGSPPPEPKPVLKALQLTPTPATPSKLPGRKLEPQEEDEEDRRERSRLEAALKLMGIDKSTHPNPVVHGVNRSSSYKATGTPLSRLSSALGFSDTQLPADPDPTPAIVDAALKDYDEKEKARRLSLSTGKAEGVIRVHQDQLGA